MKELRKQLKELEKRNQHLSFENLKMRLEIDVLMDQPDSRAAKKILDKYRRKRERVEEVFKAAQN